MAETDLFPLTPDYGLPIEVDRGVIQQTAESGQQIERVKRAPRAGVSDPRLCFAFALKGFSLPEGGTCPPA